MISVIMPTYNAGRHLREALASVLAQTVADIEVLCIDDGSQDNSAWMIAEFQSRDCRVRCFHQRNAGLGAARNRGLEECRGDFVFFMDADDLLVPNALETLLSLQRRNDADIAVGGFSWIYETPNALYYVDEVQEIVCGDDGALALADETKICASVWGKLYRKELLENTRFSGIRTFEDNEFNIRIFARAKKVVRTPAVLYCYRQVGSSLIHDRRHYEWSFEAAQQLCSLCLGLHANGGISTYAAIALIRKYCSGNIMARLMRLSNIHGGYSRNETRTLLDLGRSSLESVLEDGRSQLRNVCLLEFRHRLVFTLSFRAHSTLMLRFFAKAQSAFRSGLGVLKGNWHWSTNP